eukprot:g6233.t1
MNNKFHKLCRNPRSIHLDTSKDAVIAAKKLEKLAIALSSMKRNIFAKSIWESVVLLHLELLVVSCISSAYDYNLDKDAFHTLVHSTFPPIDSSSCINTSSATKHYGMLDKDAIQFVDESQRHFKSRLLSPFTKDDKNEKDTRKSISRLLEEFEPSNFRKFLIDKLFNIDNNLLKLEKSIGTQQKKVSSEPKLLDLFFPKPAVSSSPLSPSKEKQSSNCFEKFPHPLINLYSKGKETNLGCISHSEDVQSILRKIEDFQTIHNELTQNLLPKLTKSKDWKIQKKKINISKSTQNLLLEKSKTATLKNSAENNSQNSELSSVSSFESFAIGEENTTKTITRLPKIPPIHDDGINASFASLSCDDLTSPASSTASSLSSKFSQQTRLLSNFGENEKNKPPVSKMKKRLLHKIETKKTSATYNGRQVRFDVEKKPENENNYKKRKTVRLNRIDDDDCCSLSDFENEPSILRVPQREKTKTKQQRPPKTRYTLKNLRKKKKRRQLRPATFASTKAERKKFGLLTEENHSKEAWSQDEMNSLFSLVQILGDTDDAFRSIIKRRNDYFPNVFIGRSISSLRSKWFSMKGKISNDK